MPLRWIVALLPLLASAACGGSDSPSGPTPTPVPVITTDATPGPTPDETGTPVTLGVIDFGFAPAQFTVTIGTTVVATNRGQVSHTWTARPGGAQSWDFPLEPGETARLTMAEPGTYAFFCAVHPDRMTGTVTVR